jgi:hypothetical protein
MISLAPTIQTPIKAPIAVSLGDLSADRCTITDGHIKVSDMINNGELDPSDLTDADRILRIFSPQLSQDHIGGEDYWTDQETNVRNGIYTSLHGMILGGRARQHFHYHPPGDSEMPESSLRAVIVVPLKNIGQNDEGLTFEWFDVNNVNLISPEQSPGDPRIHPYIEGDKASLLHRVHLDPGKASIVMFGRGVHRFYGNAIALSLHFLDVSKNRGNTFEGNTAGWTKEDGDNNLPKEVKEIKAFDYGAHKGLSPIQIPYELSELFTRYGSISRRAIELAFGDGVDPDNPLTEDRVFSLLDDLRAA